MLNSDPATFFAQHLRSLQTNLQVTTCVHCNVDTAMYNVCYVTYCTQHTELAGSRWICVCTFSKDDFSNIPGVIQQLLHKPHCLWERESVRERGTSQQSPYRALASALRLTHMTGEFMNSTIFREIRLLLRVALVINTATNQ